MRCRKVRSCLSAYCSDELTGSRKLAVSEHLSTCADCRREESEFRALHQAAREVPGMTTSNDFTTKLFNRIAEERFAETRSKAYMPKRAPMLRWTVFVPSVAAACLALVVGAMVLLPLGGNNPAIMAGLTNPSPAQQAEAVSLQKDWSLSTQMARAERLNRISRAVGAQVDLDRFHPAYGAGAVNLQNSGATPYFSDFYRLRPVVRVYQSPDATNGEVRRTY